MNRIARSTPVFIGCILLLSALATAVFLFGAVKITNSAQAEQPAATSSEQKVNLSPVLNLRSQLSGNPSSPSTDDVEPISFWIYPGEPACNTKEELDTLGQVYQLKPEFVTITTTGDTEILLEPETGCNALTRTNADLYKSVSGSQFITVSAGAESLQQLLVDRSKMDSSIELLVELTQQLDYTGVELDYEGYSSWTEEMYSGYKYYLQSLGDKLQSQGRELMIDAPAIYNDGIQSVFQFKYEDMAELPVDWITMMAYDYQYDFGGGAAVAPDDFLKSSIERAKNELGSSQSKLIIGLPTYGYTAAEGEYQIKILTYEQIVAAIGDPEALDVKRLPDSQELIYKNGQGDVYVFQDKQSLEHKIELVQDMGVEQISIWHLGGNVLPTIKK